MRAIYFLFILGSVAAAHASEPNCKVLEVSHYFDGTREHLTEKRFITISQGKIAQISDRSPVGSKSCAALDLRSLVLAPGLIDSHTHLLLTDTHYGRNLSDDLLISAKLKPEQRFRQSLIYARSLLEAGFTTVRDLGNSGQYLDHKLSQYLEAHPTLGPRVYYSGPGIAIIPAQFSPKAPTQWIEQEYSLIQTPEQAEKLVAQHVKHGVSLIKVYADNDPDAILMPQDLLEAVVSAAHRVHLKVAAHATNKNAALDAADAGVDSLEHGFELDDEIIASLKRNHSTLVPTDFDQEECQILSVKSSGPDFQNCEQYHKRMSKRLMAAHLAGIPIAFGSDMYIQLDGKLEDRGQATLGSLMAYVEEGLTVNEALHAATSQAAALLGKEDLGAIQVGMKADLIGFTGDPFKDAHKLSQVTFVMKDGAIVSGYKPGTGQ